MIFHLIIIACLLLLFVYISYKSYEGFNTSYDQDKYSPNTDRPIPKALDGITTFLSPDSKGKCPPNYVRDTNDVNSLCHSPCNPGAKFYSVDGLVQGCSILNMYIKPTKKDDKIIMPFAADKKTRIVSPEPNGSCPTNLILDTKSGLCHTACEDPSQTFYGTIGCSALNTGYKQSQYGTTENPYPLANDEKTKYVSPTSNAKCPEGFILDHASGLCYTKCSSGIFDGQSVGTNIAGCR
jgi:hypothetical protein